MGIKVHGLAISTCTARVLLCLQEKGIEYELAPVDLATGAHKHPHFLSKNPFGTIPALEDGDCSLFESRAITRYLGHKHKDKGTDLLRLDSFTESASVNTWMEVEAHQFNGPMTAIIMEMFINPLFLGKSADELVIDAEMVKLERVLDVYEERLSKFKYLAGDFYSMADLHHIPHLVYFMTSPRATAITSRPHVNAWWISISSRPASIKVSAGMKY